jgi:hypothetical protein
MDQQDVFRVFIPGETSNRDIRQSVIGSFGMGAKKGIFRLTDGARVVSSPDGKMSYTSEVPEKWELEKSWITRDGTAEAIPAGETHLYLFKLVNPPTQSEIEELRRRAGMIYAPLLNGELGKLCGQPKSRIRMKINGGEVEASSDIAWANPEGAEPLTYEFTNEFPNNAGGTDPIPLKFVLRWTRKATCSSRPRFTRDAILSASTCDVGCGRERLRARRKRNEKSPGSSAGGRATPRGPLGGSSRRATGKRTLLASPPGRQRL